MSSFAIVKKLHVIEKKCLEKKSFHLICADDIIKTVGGIFLKNKWVVRHLILGDFTVSKNCSSE